MAKCSCAGSSCSCTIQAGNGLQVTGTGNNSAPFTVSLSAQFVQRTVLANGPLDLSAVPAGAFVEVLLSANATSVILPNSPGQRIDLLVRQVVAGRTIAWPAGIKWPGGAAPVLATTINYSDWLAIRQLQTDWMGAIEGAAIR